MRFTSSVLLLAATGLAAQVSAASIYSPAYDVARDVKDPIAQRDMNHRRRHLKRQNRNQNAGNGGNQNGGNQNAGNQNAGNNAGNNGGNNAAANPTCLAANAVQTASAATGQNGDIAAGQVESQT